MSLDFFTSLSIYTLIFGSLAVFAWFLVDAYRLLRDLEGPRREVLEDRPPGEPESPGAGERD
jgi:hypothetical protein